MPTGSLTESGLGSRGGLQGLEQVALESAALPGPGLPCAWAGAYSMPGEVRVNAKNQKLELPGLKSVSLLTHSVTFHVTLSLRIPICKMGQQ